MKMISRIWQYLLIVVAAVSMGFVSQAQAELSAEEIVKKANIAALYNGADGRAEARMKIVDAQGRTQYRQFTMLRKDIEDGGDQRFYVLFSRPSEVARTVFLVNKHAGSDDERWLYLPGLDMVKRIAAGDKRTSFVGSHFFYEDISGRDIKADSYRLIDSSGDHYVVEATPNDPKAVEFSRYLITIDKAHFLPVKAEYFDKTNTAYRLAETVKVEVIDGHPTGTRLIMKDLRDGGQTLTEMRFIQYDIGVPDSVFTERSMRTPPKDWIKRK
ncbi:MAG: outer membrane lipoprotein-sorting protein [Gammaproteobacteria bacterium]|nr:MAG: outer membrane lipoprotein-sorting protein [Gammaproteobacteria bacterium]